MLPMLEGGSSAQAGAGGGSERALNVCVKPTGLAGSAGRKFRGLAMVRVGYKSRRYKEALSYRQGSRWVKACRYATGVGRLGSSNRVPPSGLAMRAAPIRTRTPVVDALDLFTSI